MLKLRPYQLTGIQQIREQLLAGKRSVLYTAPTGSGKTCLVAHMIKTAVDRGKRAWFLVHRRELLNQSIRTLEDSAGVSTGIIAAGYGANGYHLAQVASINSLMRRWEKYALPDLLIADEVHHICSDSWSKLISNIRERSPNTCLIGLTATPERLDGRGLGQHFESLVEGPQVKWLIDNGYLSKYRMFGPPSGVDMAGVHTIGGDWNKAEVDERMRRSTVTGDAIAEYKQHCAGKRALVFAWSVQSSDEIAEAFKSSGIPAAHIDGETPDNIRDKIISDYRDGQVKVLTNCEIVTEGFDLAGIEACFLLRPTQSLGMYLQMVGRALRPGKEFAYIFDHCRLWFQHGLPDRHREWSLEGCDAKARRKIKNPVRQCPKCYFVLQAPAQRCKACGFVFEIKPREVKQEDGELQELNLEDAARLFKVEKRREQGQARDYDALKQIEKKNGYKPGWAAHVMMARYRKRPKYPPAPVLSNDQLSALSFRPKKREDSE